MCSETKNDTAICSIVRLCAQNCQLVVLTGCEQIQRSSNARNGAELTCHHKLEEFLEEYIAAAGIANDPKGWLFRTTKGQSGTLTERPMSQTDVYRVLPHLISGQFVENWKPSFLQ